jgi:hypothetical protein
MPEQEPTPIHIHTPWRIIFLITLGLICTTALLGGWEFVYQDIETKRDATKIDSLRTERQQSTEGVKRDRDETERAAYIWKAESLKVYVAEKNRNRPRKKNARTR